MAQLVQGRTDTIRWASAAPWASRLFDAQGLQLTTWVDGGCATVVKDGPHRTVHRVAAGGDEFFVKHYRCQTVWDTARHWFRRSPARREWLKACEVTRRGVATVTPLAWQEQKQRGPVGESYFVAEAIPHTCTLDEYFETILPALEPRVGRRVLRQLIVQLARFVAQVHEAGIQHNDFHTGNLLISLNGDQPWCDRSTGRFRFHLIDIPGVRFSGPLSWEAARQNLVVLNAAWFRRLAVRDRLRFWQAYRSARPELAVGRRSALEQLERGTAVYYRRHLGHRDRRILRTSSDFVALRRGPYRAHGLRELDEAALQRLTESPEAVLQANLHRPVKLSRSTMIVQATLPVNGEECPVAIKRYRPRNGWKALLARFRQPRALRSWHRAHALRIRGIATARPVAAVSARPGESYLALEWIRDSRNLHLYLWALESRADEERAAQTDRCAEQLGKLLGTLHAQRAYHGDLKGANLLITDRQGRIEAHLVDVDSVRLNRTMTLRRRAADLARLAASVEAHRWLSHSTRLRFLRAYLRELPGVSDWKQHWRAIARRADRINRRKRRKREPIV